MHSYCYYSVKGNMNGCIWNPALWQVVNREVPVEKVVEVTMEKVRWRGQ